MAPSPGENRFDIKMTSKPGSSLTLTLTFLSPVSVSVNPKQAGVKVLETQQFSASVPGTSDQSVAWSIISNGNEISGAGMVDGTGLSAAPNLAPEPPFVTIKPVAL